MRWPMHKTLGRKQILLLLALYFIGYMFFYQGILATQIYEDFGLSVYLICNQICYCLMIILFAIITFPWLMKQYRRYRRHEDTILKMCFFAVFLQYFVSVFLTLAVYRNLGMSEAENQVNNIALLNLNIPGFIFAAVVFAPFVEEIIFRGCIFEPVKHRFGFWVAALVSAITFGFVHILATISTGNWINIWYILSYGLSGFFMAWLFESTDTIITPMFVHGFYNLLSIMIILV